MIEIKAPNPHEHLPIMTPQIFLAGSIEMGTAEPWQEKIAQALKDEDVILLNPRRDDWDFTWEQRINNPKFKEQVLWELNSLETADIIVFYIDPNTKSPITLMELGMFAVQNNVWKNIVVCCADGFWRKGNVEVVCDRFGIPLVTTKEDLVAKVKEYVSDYVSCYINTD